MVTFVLYITLISGTHQVSYAVGFINEGNCWEWTAQYVRRLPQGIAWMGSCMPLGAFKVWHPEERIL